MLLEPLFMAWPCMNAIWPKRRRRGAGPRGREGTRAASCLLCGVPPRAASCLRACVPACLHASMSSCFHVCMLPCLHASMSACFRVCMLPGLHADVSTCFHVFMLPCLYASVSACFCVFTLPCLGFCGGGRFGARPCSTAQGTPATGRAGALLQDLTSTAAATGGRIHMPRPARLAHHWSANRESATGRRLGQALPNPGLAELVLRSAFRAGFMQKFSTRQSNIRRALVKEQCSLANPVATCGQPALLVPSSWGAVSTSNSRIRVRWV